MDIHKIRQENINRIRQFEAEFLASTTLLGGLAPLPEDIAAADDDNINSNGNSKGNSNSNSNSSSNIGRSSYFANKALHTDDLDNFIVPAYADISAKCKYRENHVLTIFSYLNQHPSVAAYPLVLKGIGSGKSHVLQFVSKAIESTCLLMSCCGRTSISQFLSLLWIRIMKKYSYEIKKKVSYTFKNRDVDYFFDKLEGAFDNCKAKIVIFIDNIDELEKTEKSFCEKLFLSVSRRAQRTSATLKVRLVCAINDFDVDWNWSVMPLDFPTFSEAEVRNVVDLAIENGDLSPSSFVKRATNDVRENVGVESEVSNNDSSNSNSNSNSSSSSSLVTSNEANGLLKSIEESKTYVKSIANQALPLILMKTRNIGEIKVAISSIVDKLFQPQSMVSENKKVDIKAAVQLPQASLPVVSKDLRLQMPRSQISMTMNNSVKLPIWRMSVSEGEEPVLVTNKRLRQNIEDKNGYLKLDSDSLRATDWCNSIPEISKYIIIAAFLASLNPPDSDIHQFAGLKRKKRRKVADGREEVDSSAQYASRNSHNVIKLERLLSILTTIYSSSIHASGISLLGKVDDMSDPRKVIQIVNHSFGDSHLFSAIASLEESGLLIKVSPWSLDHPRYNISITKAMAMDVAASVSFPIMDYLPNLS